MVNYSVLKHVIPSDVIEELLEVTTKYRLNDPLRLSHFLSQCSHESRNFTKTEENLSYSTDRILVVFKKYFPTKELALQYTRKPEKLGSRVYANRMGNGSEESGDGYRFRGRGYIQLTGKVNYTNFCKSVSDNVLLNPDLVATKYPLTSAAWFWNQKDLNEIADQGNSEVQVREITKKINGGLIGLEDRIRLFNKFYNLINEY